MEQDLVKFSMEPRTLDEAMKYAEIIAKSDLVPKYYQGKPGNVLIAIQWGQEIGLKPMQALQNIAVINGTPSLYGDAPLALVRNSGLLEDFREDFDEKSMTATCTSKRKGQPTVIVRTFSMEDAKRAGLWGKNNYQTYPRRQLQMRARGFNLRDGFGDVLKGLAIAEEQQDVLEVEGQITSEALPPPPPPPAPPTQTDNGAPDATDWRDLTTRRDGTCCECGDLLPTGTLVLYSPSRSKIKCKVCPPKGAAVEAVAGVDAPTF